jgi:hypothetical protein
MLRMAHLAIWRYRPHGTMVFHGTNGDFVGMTMIATYTLTFGPVRITYQGVIIVQGE